MLFVLVFGTLGFYVGSKWFDCEEIEDSFEDMRHHISNMKRRAKGKSIKFTSFKLKDPAPKEFETEGD